jgi:hypothetical protein
MKLGYDTERSIDPYGEPFFSFCLWVLFRRLRWKVGAGAFVRGFPGRGWVRVGRVQHPSKVCWQARFWRVAVAARRLTAAELCAQPSTNGAEVGQ